MHTVEQTIVRCVDDLNNGSPKNMEIYNGAVAEYIWEKYEDTIMPEVYLYKVKRWKGTEFEIKEPYEEYVRCGGHQCLLETFYATPVKMWPDFEKWFTEAVDDQLYKIIEWLEKYGP